MWKSIQAGTFSLFLDGWTDRRKNWRSMWSKFI